MLHEIRVLIWRDSEMNRKVVLLVVGLLLVAGCSTDPTSVATQFQDAVNSKDLEAALELLAEDAVIQIHGAQSRTGKQEIETWLATQAELNYRFDGDPTASGSGVAFESCSISSETWITFGINPMTGTCEAAVEGGLITRFTIQVDEDSKARLSESSAPVAADLIRSWEATGVTPQETKKVIPFFMQFFEDGSTRLAISPDDLLIAPDPEHPGVLLTWTYEDYVLTVQNQGPAMEGYCQDQDVGKYLVRNTEGGGILFRPLGDPCGWRTTTLNHIGVEWDPYVP